MSRWQLCGQILNVRGAFDKATSALCYVQNWFNLLRVRAAVRGPFRHSVEPLVDVGLDEQQTLGHRSYAGIVE
jgi:hypothetical protein